MTFTFRSEDEKELWNFLKIMFEENARTALLNYLGFSLPDVKESKVEEFSSDIIDLNAQITNNLNLSNGTNETIDANSSSLRAPEVDVQQTNFIDDGADFFNNLSTPKGALSPKSVPSIEEACTEETIVHEEEHDGLDEEDDNDRAVHHALTIGDFKDAVKQCLLANRMADALVLAHVGGSELWDETLTEYLRKHRRPYRKV